MGATLLDGVIMEPGSIVGAGAVVPPGASQEPTSRCMVMLGAARQQSSIAVSSLRSSYRHIRILKSRDMCSSLRLGSVFSSQPLQLYV
jgi:carbonic anhydrase/acetyltransferase-like protein (isoleucine patch superfamily)